MSLPRLRCRLSNMPRLASIFLPRRQSLCFSRQSVTANLNDDKKQAALIALVAAQVIMAGVLLDDRHRHFSAMRAGKELANAETWKRAQVRSAAIADCSVPLVGIAKALRTRSRSRLKRSFLAVAVGVVVGLFIGTATVVSTSRIGLSPGVRDDLPGAADGIRDGATEGRPYDWIRRHWTTEIRFKCPI